MNVTTLIVNFIIVIPIILYLIGNKAVTGFVISFVNCAYVVFIALIMFIIIAFISYFFGSFDMETFSDVLLLVLLLFFTGSAYLILKGVGFFECIEAYKKDRLSCK